jgi:hypothetical protein
VKVTTQLNITHILMWSLDNSLANRKVALFTVAGWLPSAHPGLPAWQGPTTTTPLLIASGVAGLARKECSR